jgi:hypothetical protein
MTSVILKCERERNTQTAVMESKEEIQIEEDIQGCRKVSSLCDERQKIPNTFCVAV